MAKADSNMETNNKIVEKYFKSDEKQDTTLIQNSLEKFAKDKNHLVLTEDGQDVTAQHEKKLLEFNDNHDYKAAKEYVLKEDISIGYSDN